jgi:hypothetical protein
MFYRSRFGGEARTLKDRLGVIPARQKEPAAEEAGPEQG